MFEHFKEELISLEKFVVRVIRFYLIATALLLFALIPGIVGFYWMGELNMKESAINALSILGTIDPPHPLSSDAGQVFTAIYGLFSDTVFLLSLGILLAPIIHRLFHKFHLHAD